MKKLFDFLCSDCGHEFEKFAEGTQKVECPSCGSTSTTKLISPSAIKVAGQGAYTNKMKV